MALTVLRRTQGLFLGHCREPWCSLFHFLMPDLIVFSFPQLERQGALLVEFEVPLITDPKLPAQWQSIVLEEDVIQCLPPMDYSLEPGDKVLAPWEPDQQRYGPGTVILGSGTREPQRGKGSYSDLSVPRGSQAGRREQKMS